MMRAVTAGLEFQIPPYVVRYASFYFSFLGRGICQLRMGLCAMILLWLIIFTVYIFIGSILLGEHWYNFVPGSIVAIVGIGYAVLEFIPSIEPPANMKEADQGWGAEQV